MTPWRQTLVWLFSFVPAAFEGHTHFELPSPVSADLWGHVHSRFNIKHQSSVYWRLHVWSQMLKMTLLRPGDIWTVLSASLHPPPPPDTSNFSHWRWIVAWKGFRDSDSYKLFSSVLDKTNTLPNINDWFTHLVYSSSNVINVNLCTHEAIGILGKQWSMRATKLHCGKLMGSFVLMSSIFIQH